MKKHIYDESNGLSYTLHGDYYLPDLAVNEDELTYGKYGMLRKDVYKRQIQFHPEVLHTVEGTKMINNFVKNVCECAGDWKMDAFVENTIAEIREKVGNGRVLLALSGGVDSSVAAGLLSKAIGKQLTCVFVDHGLLRKNEGDEVEAIFGPEGQFDLNFIRVNAQERYYNKLAGVTAVSYTHLDVYKRQGYRRTFGSS